MHELEAYAMCEELKIWLGRSSDLQAKARVDFIETLDKRFGEIQSREENTEWKVVSILACS